MTLGILFAAVLGFTLGTAAFDDPVTGRCSDGRVWTTEVAEQAQMARLVNKVRADAGRRPLTRVEVLDRMAMAHAIDMACRNYFDHTNPERHTLPERLSRADVGARFAWHHLAEVIGTSVLPARQLERWLDSRPHRRAVLEREHDRVGIGLVRISGSRYRSYWAVEFAAGGR